MSRAIRIHDADNVAVAIDSLKAGDCMTIGPVTIAAVEDVPAGHKISLSSIDEGENVIKYGSPIGQAIFGIKPGSWVHTHNIKTNLSGLQTYQYNSDAIGHTIKAADLDKFGAAIFMGFRRTDGRVGVRNDIWIIPTVGCVNGVVSALAHYGEKFAHGSISGVYAFPHSYGCSQMGEDQENTRKILADLIEHPNAGGVLVVGLGCENSPIEVIQKYLRAYNPTRIRFLNCQDIEDELETGKKIVQELINTVAEDVRVKVNISKLVVGLKCGASDGFSGITANPVVGRFSDKLISLGGSTILTEVPEMFGAETHLMNRCRDEELFNRTVKLINDFKNYFIDNNQPIYENPSPGNKTGGISTLEEKSLGCTQKSGTSQVVDVLAYGEKIKFSGLNLLSAPGNDLVAVTALAASGAHIVLFTTGLGTPYACPVPTVKISSNTSMALKKNNWIDFDAGSILNGLTIGEASEALFEKVLEIASGCTLKSEEAGYKDFAIFKNGVTL